MTLLSLRCWRCKHIICKCSLRMLGDEVEIRCQNVVQGQTCNAFTTARVVESFTGSSVATRLEIATCAPRQRVLG